MYLYDFFGSKIFLKATPFSILGNQDLINVLKKEFNIEL